MKSYLEKAQSKRFLNVNADEFISKQIETNTNTTSYEQNQMQFHMDPFNTQDSHGQPGFDTVDLETRNDVLGIMRKQNEITLLMQQQCLLALPKREIPIYDCDPLNYHMFIKAFENGVEKNTTNSCDHLYFFETTHKRSGQRACEKLSTNKSRTRLCKSKSFVKGTVRE